MRPGADGVGCSIVATDDGAEITCGSSGDKVAITNGVDGADGITTTVTASSIDGPCFDDVNRFVDCGNGSIHDQYTGLIWISKVNCRLSSEGQGTGHAEAYRAATTLLQHGLCDLTDNSQPGDWRLPTEEEALSILDSSCDNPTVPDQLGTGCTTTDALWTFHAAEAARTFPTSTYDGTSDVMYGNLRNGRTYSWQRAEAFVMSIWAVRSI